MDHCMVHAKGARVIQDVPAQSVPECTSDHCMILMTVNVASGQPAKCYIRQSLRRKTAEGDDGGARVKEARADIDCLDRDIANTVAYVSVVRNKVSNINTNS